MPVAEFAAGSLLAASFADSASVIPTGFRLCFDHRGGGNTPRRLGNCFCGSGICGIDLRGVSDTVLPAFGASGGDGQTRELACYPKPAKGALLGRPVAVLIGRQWVAVSRHQSLFLRTALFTASVTNAGGL